MKKFALPAVILALCCGALVSVVAQDAPKTAAAPAAAAPAVAPAAAASAAEPKDEICFEGRKGATEITKRELKPGWPNVKCSPVTGAALWYGDPYDGTKPMGKVPLLEKIPAGMAVMKPRSDKLNLLAQCGTACHNGVYPKGYPKDNKPVPIPTMVAMLPELQNFSHGRGAIWCLDCHHPVKRNMLVDHYGGEISIDDPQLLCGKCHGDKLRDWRDGIHGKRIGDFTSTGKKRWFSCTECHNPHDVQHGERNKGFAALQPETPPQLPLGMKDASHEKRHPIAH